MFPFSDLPTPLLRFLIFEKSYVYTESIQRKVFNKENDLMCCGVHFSDVNNPTKYQVSDWKPVVLTGIWVPSNEGALFTENKIPKLFQRINHGKQEILFLVHPLSIGLFAPLIQKYSKTKLSIPSLTLSSIRSILVAIPNKKGSWDYMMVKLTLNEIISGASRLISCRDAALSVGNTCLLKHKNIPLMSFLPESSAFVPIQERIDTNAVSTKNNSEKHLKKLSEGCGMIIRTIPDYLMSTDSDYTLIPAFSLLSNHGQLLEILSSQHNKHPFQFVEDHIILPMAKIYVSALFIHSVSIQAHLQNILLKINIESGQLCSRTPFIHRDMGGINISLNNTHKVVPYNLRDPSIYYANEHIYDAATSLETHFVSNFVYNFTKWAVKNHQKYQRHPPFSEWIEKVKKKYSLGNWTTGNTQDYRHQTVIEFDKFILYGYFELIFGKYFQNELYQQGIQKTLEVIPENAYKWKKQMNDFPNDNKYNWFFTFITWALPEFQRIKDNSENLDNPLFLLDGT